jgi:hypothetical protein
MKSINELCRLMRPPITEQWTAPSSDRRAMCCHTEQLWSLVYGTAYVDTKSSR